MPIGNIVLVVQLIPTLFVLVAYDAGLFIITVVANFHEICIK